MYLTQSGPFGDLDHIIYSKVGLQLLIIRVTTIIFTSPI